MNHFFQITVLLSLQLYKRHVASLIFVSEGHWIQGTFHSRLGGCGQSKVPAAAFRQFD